MPKKPEDYRRSLNNAPNSDPKYGQKNEAILNKIKNMSLESASNMRLLEMNMTKPKQENQDRPSSIERSQIKNGI